MAAIFALGLTMTSVVATDQGVAYKDLTKAEINMDSSELTKVEIKVDGELPNIDNEEWLGVGVITTDGAIFGAASHGGFYDSWIQTPPVMGVCDSTAPFDTCEEYWHDHLIYFKETNGDCNAGDLAVDRITFEQIADTLEIDGNEVKALEISRALQAYTNSLTAMEEDFQLGQPNGVVVSFNLYGQGADVCAHIQDAIEPQKFKGTD